jgi:proteasome-associated ATPase
MTQAQASISPDIPGGIPEDLPIEQERALVEAAVRKNPPAAASLALMFLNQKHRYKTLAEERGRQLEQIAAAPWIPATLLARIREDWAMVAIGSRQMGVAIGPNVDRAALAPGCPVFLNREQSAIVEFSPRIPRAGAVGRFSRRHGAQAVIRGPSDEELVLHLPATLQDAEFMNGDLLLYDRDAMIVLDRIATKHEHANLLEEVRSDLRIRDLGALDEIFQNILEDVLMCFLHREVAERHQLEPVRSIMLIGPPGVGKTSLMKCVANELSELAGVRVRVLLARPSIHRSKWYGESEEKVRAMFDEVKRAAREDGGYIVLFFDDADQLGSRDTINDVDARVLPAFLHEVESLRAVDRVLLVAATNKPELVDPALSRASATASTASRGRAHGRRPVTSCAATFARACRAGAAAGRRRRPPSSRTR